MAEKYTSEQFWQLYEKLPQELKEAIFSEETAENIFGICIRNGITDRKISEVARYTGRVLLGILPPNSFQETLEKELKIKKDSAKKVFLEINRFIFYPIKPSLEQLYEIEIVSKPIGKAPLPQKIAAPKEPEKAEEKKAAPLRKDKYREPIE